MGSKTFYSCNICILRLFFYTYYSQTDLKVCKGQEQSKAGNFWFLFSLVLLLLLLSCQLFKVKTSLFERKHCYLSESIIIFHSNDHPISSQRKKEPQIRRLKLKFWKFQKEIVVSLLIEIFWRIPTS